MSGVSGGVVHGRDHTLDEVAKCLGLSKERVRQIEAKALFKLRGPSCAKALAPFLETGGGGRGSGSVRLNRAPGEPRGRWLFLRRGAVLARVPDGILGAQADRFAPEAAAIPPLRCRLRVNQALALFLLRGGVVQKVPRGESGLRCRDCGALNTVERPVSWMSRLCGKCSSVRVLARLGAA